MMEILSFHFDYQIENHEIYNKFENIIFNDSNIFIKPGEIITYPGIGSVMSGKVNFYTCNLYMSFKENSNESLNHLNYIQNKIPLVFEKINSFKKGITPEYRWISIIGYKDENNYITEHVHDNNYIAIYYLDNHDGGTEVWNNNCWETLENKSGNMFIIPGKMIHRFFMKNNNKRMMISLNFN